MTPVAKVQILRRHAHRPPGSSITLMPNDAAAIVAVIDDLARRLGDALLYIESYGGQVTDSYAAAGNLTDNKEFLLAVQSP